MGNIKDVAIIGEVEIGKTTLANALLGWDIFPQSTWDLYIPTEKSASHMLTDGIQLTDTPGYDLWWYRVPEAVEEAVSRADTIIMMLSGLGAGEDVDWEAVNPEDAKEIRQWLENLAREEMLHRELLAKAKTRDIYFVIPFDGEDGPLDQAEMDRDLHRTRERFMSLTEHGGEGFFRIDPMMALIGAIEDDQEALAKSGILELKAALLGAKE